MKLRHPRPVIYARQSEIGGKCADFVCDTPEQFGLQGIGGFGPLIGADSIVERGDGAKNRHCAQRLDAPDKRRVALAELRKRKSVEALSSNTGHRAQAG